MNSQLNKLRINALKALMNLTLMTLCLNATAQKWQYDWSYTGGASKGNTLIGSQIINDSNGNVYGVSYLVGTIKFGYNNREIISNGETDLLITKWTENGQLVWEKLIGGKGHDFVAKIDFSHDKKLLLFGYFEDSVDFNPNHSVSHYETAPNEGASFVLKLDTNSNFIWVKTITSTKRARPLDFQFDSKGDILLTGSFSGTADFDPSEKWYRVESKGGLDGYLCKLNSNGEYSYVKTFGGSQDDAVVKIALDAHDNVYLGMEFQDEIGFSINSKTVTYKSKRYDNYDLAILRLNNSWKVEWANHFAGDARDIVRSITWDKNIGLLITGSYQGDISFNPSKGTHNHSIVGYGDGFVVKMDSAGNIKWSHKLGIRGSDHISDAIVHDNKITLFGSFGETANFDFHGLNRRTDAKGGADLFIFTIDSAANYLELQILPGTGSQVFSCSYLDHEGNLLLSGRYFMGNFDSDPGSGVNNEIYTGSVYARGFYLKLLRCNPLTAIDTVMACDKYSWIDGNEYEKSTTSPVHLISKGQDCDSLIKLDLTVNYSTNSTDSLTKCEPFKWINGKTYTNSNYNDLHVLTNTKGCDSIVHLKLTLPNMNLTIKSNGNQLVANEKDANYQWIDCDNDEVIQGETNQSFTPKLSGSYAVQLEKNGCTERSKCIKHIVGSINNESNQTTVSFYPNPSDNLLNFEFGDPTISRVDIYAIDGRLEHQFKVESEFKTIDVSEWVPSVYLIKVYGKSLYSDAIFIKN